MKAGEAVKHSPGCGPGHRNQSCCCCSSHYVTEATLRLFFGFSLTDPIELLPWHVKKRGSPPPPPPFQRDPSLHCPPLHERKKHDTPGFFFFLFFHFKSYTTREHMRKKGAEPLLTSDRIALPQGERRENHPQSRPGATSRTSGELSSPLWHSSFLCLLQLLRSSRLG